MMDINASLCLIVDILTIFSTYSAHYYPKSIPFFNIFILWSLERPLTHQNSYVFPFILTRLLYWVALCTSTTIPLILTMHIHKYYLIFPAPLPNPFRACRLYVSGVYIYMYTCVCVCVCAPAALLLFPVEEEGGCGSLFGFCPQYIYISGLVIKIKIL